jgi:MerR family copper efflux transcriptional regulator
MGRAVTIGQLARATGVAARTIRYYEHVGVLPPADRTAAGYRRYDEHSVQRLLFVRRARSLGLPLRHLGALSGALRGGPQPALRPRLLALVREQLSAVQQQRAELRLLQQQLEHVLRRLRTSPRGPRGRPCRCLDVER